MQKERINIAIIDHHQLFREGMRLILESQDSFNIVVNSNDNSLIETLENNPIDILLIDIHIFRKSKDIMKDKITDSCPEMKIIVLANKAEKNYVTELIQSGINGYLLKEMPPSVFVDAIKDVYEGRYYICSSLAHELIIDYRKLAGIDLAVDEKSSGFKKPDFLTNREFEVLKLIANGESNSQISHHLKISDKTVKNHVNSLFKKMDVNSRTQAAVHAIRSGLVEAPKG